MDRENLLLRNLLLLSAIAAKSLKLYSFFDESIEAIVASEAKRSELAREPPVTVWEKEATAYLENEAF